ncbi:hypothetical protein Q2T41_00040 [Maribacter confluentis]|uniref:Uncharacterized protein n=1 Tax=Maribacter confluentis TaxID=1656093 RepID=A0ABT8RIW4_9FLAO|nr:hypothetical protein [Maribacter confluentis]MDO1511053.1 hypothetical protein [Maribacter confluentis]
MSKEVEFTNLIRDHQGLLFKVTSNIPIPNKTRKTFFKMWYFSYGSTLIRSGMSLKLPLGCIKLP